MRPRVDVDREPERDRRPDAGATRTPMVRWFDRSCEESPALRVADRRDAADGDDRDHEGWVRRAKRRWIAFAGRICLFCVRPRART
ncbi:hypothetical protein WK26_12750 [Burkholderia vietnamiensis]|nr:hypothetical protein WK26_12750 [Burkholderia vietnamiensis]KVS38065.1 hypothetical protein WK35_31170 [Burkholderia vietnamiensis]